MIKLPGNTSIVCLALAGILVSGVTLGQAQSASHLDKHARKILHKLAKYPSGRYLHLVMRAHNNSYGALGQLSPNSFTFVNADTNSTASYAYSDVERVNAAKEPIGEGTEPRRHIRHLVPIVVSAAAVGAAGAVYAAER